MNLCNPTERDWATTLQNMIEKNGSCHWRVEKRKRELSSRFKLSSSSHTWFKQLLITLVLADWFSRQQNVTSNDLQNLFNTTYTKKMSQYLRSSLEHLSYQDHKFLSLNNNHLSPISDFTKTELPTTLKVRNIQLQCDNRPCPTFSCI